MGWLWKFLTSRNTAIVLLIVISAMLLIGAILPNPALMSPADMEKFKQESPFLFMLGENFNSMKVGRSYVFGLMGILLVISTAFCSIDRVVKRIQSGDAKLSDVPPESKSTKVKLFGNFHEIEEKLLSLFRKRRWKIKVHESEKLRIITATKGDIGFWGSIFFHSLLVTLLAGLVVFYFSGFYATMLLTEGQELMLSKETLRNIERMPVFGKRLPELLFRFNTFSAKYYDDKTAIDYTADFDITDIQSGTTWNQIFKINKPLRYKGIDFLMIMQGYSPNFMLYKDGILVDDFLVSLDFDQDYRDSFDMKQEGFKVVAQFFPDMARNEDGSVYTKSTRPNNPYFGLDIFQNDIRIFRGLVGKGEGAVFGSYRFVFSDLRYWITLNLVSETGIGFFFVCLMIGLAGVLARLFDPERKIIASMQDLGDAQMVTFSHYSKHFEAMVKEHVDDVIHNLQGEEER